MASGIASLVTPSPASSRAETASEAPGSEGSTVRRWIRHIRGAIAGSSDGSHVASLYWEGSTFGSWYSCSWCSDGGCCQGGGRECSLCHGHCYSDCSSSSCCCCCAEGTVTRCDGGGETKGRVRAEGWRCEVNVVNCFGDSGRHEGLRVSWTTPRKGKD